MVHSCDMCKSVTKILGIKGRVGGLGCKIVGDFAV